MTTIAAALLGFVSAVVLWAWFETSFLFGVVAGPRRSPCPANAPPTKRFRLAFAALRDHELALAGVLLLLTLALHDAANRVALETFAALWLCRLAAKACLFVGMPNFTHDMVPDRMRYLATYFGRGRPGLVYAAAVLGMGAMALWLLREAVTAAGAFDATAKALVGALVALALVEHVMMALPLRDSRLWTWALRHARERPSESTAPREVRGRKLQGVALRARAVVPGERDA